MPGPPRPSACRIDAPTLGPRERSDEERVTPARISWPRQDLDEKIADLVEGFRRSGLTPTPALIVRLADGRIRLYPPNDYVSRLVAVEREFGAIEKAYLVDAAAQLTVLKTSAGCAAGLSRNSAIFAASLGMATGAFPNVDSSNSPDGVLSCPV